MENTQRDSEMIPAAEAAQELGTTALAVLMQLKRGRLEGVEREGGWYVLRASLAAFRAGAAGAEPAVCRSACARKTHCGSCS